MGINMDRLTLLSLVLDITLVTLLLVGPAQRVAAHVSESKRRPASRSRRLPPTD
jgi:hypothetical protein